MYYALRRYTRTAQRRYVQNPEEVAIIPGIGKQPRAMTCRQS